MQSIIHSVHRGRGKRSFMNAPERVVMAYTVFVFIIVFICMSVLKSDEL